MPKKGKSTININNWRPISLLNVDYKIATKIIANRIKKVLGKIININQTGFIKGRFIGENVRTLLDVIEQVNNNNEEGIIFFSDFQKAFDTISRQFMEVTLQKFNFGPIFIKWVKTLYTDIQVVLLIMV